jgi:biotin-dependent carboxylase-like uncharacterized protein
MDPGALMVANSLVGNPVTAAGLEVCLGGLTIRFDRPARFALTGGESVASVDGREVPCQAAQFAGEAQALTIGRIHSGRFVYLAIDGGIAVPELLGSRSTYLPTGLGGFAGRRLAVGDEVSLGPPATEAPPPGFAPTPSGVEGEEAIRLVRGPQADLFPFDAHRVLEEETYRISPTSDRMGTRLDGPPIAPEVAATLPSEATCLGAIQVPDGGQPIVLLRDGPTVGGYLKIGAVIGADLARFAQAPLSDPVRFRWVSLADAHRALYAARERLARLLRAIREAAVASSR